MQLSDFIGKPYVNRTHDCWVVCRDVCREVYGMDLPKYAYADSDDGAEAALTIWGAVTSGRWKKVSEGRSGDILIFRIGRWACHAGVQIEGGDFIHCLHGRNTVIQKLDSDGWRNRLAGVYRWT